MVVQKRTKKNVKKNVKNQIDHVLTCEYDGEPFYGKAVLTCTGDLSCHVKYIVATIENDTIIQEAESDYSDIRDALEVIKEFKNGTLYGHHCPFEAVVADTTSSNAISIFEVISGMPELKAFPIIWENEEDGSCIVEFTAVDMKKFSEDIVSSENFEYRAFPFLTVEQAESFINGDKP